MRVRGRGCVDVRGRVHVVHGAERTQRTHVHLPVLREEEALLVERHIAVVDVAVGELHQVGNNRNAGVPGGAAQGHDRRRVIEVASGVVARYNRFFNGVRYRLR